MRRTIGTLTPAMALLGSVPSTTPNYRPDLLVVGTRLAGFFNMRRSGPDQLPQITQMAKQFDPAARSAPSTADGDCRPNRRDPGT